MKKTITITDITKVRVGDKAYFKNCDFGFTVGLTDIEDEDSPFAVYNPLSGDYYWILLSRFDHATREVNEPEWPHPDDLDLHIYLGTDGVKYFYMPTSESDQLPWSMFPILDYSPGWCSTCDLANARHEALPLTELKLVPKEEES